MRGAYWGFLRLALTQPLPDDLHDVRHLSPATQAVDEHAVPEGVRPRLQPAQLRQHPAAVRDGERHVSAPCWSVPRHDGKEGHPPERGDGSRRDEGGDEDQRDGAALVLPRPKTSKRSTEARPHSPVIIIICTLHCLSSFSSVNVPRVRVNIQTSEAGKGFLGKNITTVIYWVLLRQPISSKALQL